MTTLYSPFNGRFEALLADLVSSIVEDWDLKTCMAFCYKNLAENWKGFSLEEYVEQYELHHDSSIISEVIDWTDHLKNGEPDWQLFSLAEYHPVKITGVLGGTEIVQVLEDDEEPDFYSVYLVDHEGMSQCILDLIYENDAKVLTESINTHYLEQYSDDSE